jgi:general secretion pathway protein G
MKRVEMRIKSKRTRAFTLIELLVVLLILAILAALIVPKLFGHTDDAKRARAVSDVTELSSALDRFRADTDRYPSDQEGLQALITQPSDVTHGNWPYIAKLPTDPWGNEYVYKNLGNNQVQVMSYGSDGAEGGTGNAADISNLDGTSQPASQ